jgi:putative membrane protein
MFSLKNLGVFTHIFENKEEIILRDYLALERTKLANQRTFLSYIRTSLYLVLGGIAFLQLQDFANIRWVGYATLTLSVLMIIIGIYRFHLIRSRLLKYYNRSRNSNTD